MKDNLLYLLKYIINKPREKERNNYERDSIRDNEKKRWYHKSFHVISFIRTNYFIKRHGTIFVFILGYLALILECITPIIATLLQKDVINSVFINKEYNKFTRLLVLYGIFFFAPKVLFTIRKVAFFHISNLLQMAITSAFIQKIYELPKKTMDKEHIGKLLDQIRNDIATACDTSIHVIMSECVRSLMSIILIAFSVAYVNITMLFTVLLIGIIYYILQHVYTSRIRAREMDIREKKSKISIIMEEGISSVRETVAYNRQDFNLTRFDDSFEAYYKSLLKQGILNVQLVLMSEPFLYGTKLITILLGGFSVMNKRITLGEFVVSYTFIELLISELGQLLQQVLTGKKLYTSVHNIKLLMDKKSRDTGNIAFPKEVYQIKFDNVSFRYSDGMMEAKSEDAVYTLKNLSMDIPISKKIAIVGGSGSGKSTIAQLLLRQYEPNEGSITMNDVLIENYNEDYHDHVSVVLQNPHFIPSTVLDNLTLGSEYSQEVVEQLCKEMMIHDHIMGLEHQYDTMVGDRGSNLSGGQKQRLALVRALLKNPEILILDEATSALDLDTEHSIQKNIDKLRKGKTTIIIAHRLSTIMDADVIYLIEKGTLLSYGTHDILMMESKEYQRMYELQQITKKSSL